MAQRQGLSGFHAWDLHAPGPFFLSDLEMHWILSCCQKKKRRFVEQPCKPKRIRRLVESENQHRFAQRSFIRT